MGRSTGMLHFDGGNSNVFNSIFWANNFADIYAFGGSSTVSHNIIDQIGGITATNTLDVDPLFINAENDDFRLMSASEATNSGDSTRIRPDVLDLDGDSDTTDATLFDIAGIPRIVGAAVDRGAYEVQ